MSKIITFHSFRRGTGKSNLMSSVAFLLAAEGMRVGVIDTDLQSPSAHILFNLNAQQIKKTWNDYLWGDASIEEVVYDISPAGEELTQGKIYLAPASVETTSILRVFRERFDVERLNDGFVDIIKTFDFDFLVIDTHAGMREETIMSLAVSDMLFVVMRLDQQDYQGTSVIIDIGRHLGIKKLLLIVNDVPTSYDIDEVRNQLKETYNSKIAAILPHSPQMVALASRDIFAHYYPEHSMTDAYRNIVAQIMG